MPEEAELRFPPESEAYRKRARLDCFANFFGESVWDAHGIVIKPASANKCQDCPDAAICFRLCMMRQLESLAENQRKILSRLSVIENRLL